MKAAHIVAFILLVVGGINWGLIGLFNWGVEDLVGAGVAKVIYILVGISAIYLAVTHRKDCKACEKTSSGAASAL